MQLLLISAATIVSAIAAIPALDPYNRNTIFNDSIQLFYNGSGPVPDYNLTSPKPDPITPIPGSQIQQYFFNEVIGIINSTSHPDACSKCMAGLEIMHIAAITQPVSLITSLLIDLCNALSDYPIINAASCSAEFDETGGLGPYLAQLFSKMSIVTGDMQALCSHYQACDRPPTIAINEDIYFSPKPEFLALPEPSGKTFNVLHISDWHLDPRYDIGSEANCSQRMCCRPYSSNLDLDTKAQNPSLPASRFGSYSCDSPPDLALSALRSISNVDFAIFTGDIVSHDHDDQLSRAFVEYEEKVTFEAFKLLGVPVYATLGNHDTLPQYMNTPNSFDSKNVMSWNYELLSSMWYKNSWINSSEAGYAATHYGAYAHTTLQGLRILSINTDFWFTGNLFNYFNFTNPDSSGILTWLAVELAACEARGQRAWIIGHVLSGYSGTDALPNPSALFYSIVRRFSPSTIAGIFFGHTHQDQLQIFYDYLPNSTIFRNGVTYRNTSMVDYSKPLQMGFIGPSITPLTDLNSGYQIYQVDAETFSIVDIQTYFANISQSLEWETPIWKFEYDARRSYNVNDNWPKKAPLNATFWNDVTQSMLSNQSLVEMYNMYESKSSTIQKDCSTTECARQKVCFIRSGSADLGLACLKAD